MKRNDVINTNITRMSKKAGFVMIGVGGFIVLLAFIMGVLGGMEVMFKIMIPISMGFLPVNQQLFAWIDIPLSMSLVASLSNVMTHSEEGYLGCGQMDFLVTLAGGSADESEIPVVPAIFIQEDAELDEIQKYVIQAGPLNYPSIFCWVLALASLGALVTAIVFRIKRFKNKAADDAEMISATPDSVTVQVTPMDPKE